MFKGLEHPSGFPSMLRGSTPTNETRPNVLQRKDSHGSSPSRRHDSSGVASTGNGLSRKDSSGSSTLNRRDSFGSSILNRKDSNTTLGDTKPTKRDSLHEDFRRLSFGSSLFLRPDSTGETNLIRRDSFGRRDSPDAAHKHRIPRDYVSQLFEPKHSTTTSNGADIFETSSILRKPDDIHTNKENLDSKLISANLSKHVTILDKDGDKSSSHVDSTHNRRDSSGSLSNYLASRRISIDSLDARRNSRRGSNASADLNFGFENISEVSLTNHNNAITNTEASSLSASPLYVCNWH